MNKPLSMMIKETEQNLIKVCNESGLPSSVLDLIMQGISAKVHSLAERQSLEEEATYTRILKEPSENSDVTN